MSVEDDRYMSAIHELDVLGSKLERQDLDLDMRKFLNLLRFVLGMPERQAFGWHLMGVMRHALRDSELTYQTWDHSRQPGGNPKPRLSEEQREQLKNIFEKMGWSRDNGYVTFNRRWMDRP